MKISYPHPVSSPSHSCESSVWGTRAPHSVPGEDDRASAEGEEEGAGENTITPRGEEDQQTPSLHGVGEGGQGSTLLPPPALEGGAVVDSTDAAARMLQRVSGICCKGLVACVVLG